MNAYFVLGIVTVIWAVLLTGLGLTRKDFPPSGGGLRAIIAITALLVAGTLVALFATTHKEHPREDAAKEEQEAALEQRESTKPAAPAGKPPPSSGGTIRASESEFKIDLSGGNSVKNGEYTFEVVNDGKTDHDLAIEGSGLKETKTPLLGPGESAKLTADLGPGKYKLYCTVPGHEQSGMKVDLTVQ